MIHGMKAELSEHYTAPPKQYTEDSLLSAMETAGNEHFDEDTEKKGIGTPATRASIIEKLVKFNYVIRKGKQLIPTEDGIRLIKILPEEIKSPKLTADWENQLLQIERGHELSENFLKKIQGNLKNLTNKYSEETLDKDVSFNSNSNRNHWENARDADRMSMKDKRLFIVATTIVHLPCIRQINGFLQ